MSEQDEQSRIRAAFIDARDAPGTHVRIRVFERYGLPLTNLDNYGPSDPQFEISWHRWLFLFQCADGLERAAAMNIAFELFRSNPPSNVMTGTEGFFTHAVSESTRDMYYAKAMCLMHRHLLEDIS